MGNITAAQKLGNRLAGKNRFEDYESDHRVGYAPVPSENNENPDYFPFDEFHDENERNTPMITITE